MEHECSAYQGTHFISNHQLNCTLPQAPPVMPHRHLTHLADTQNTREQLSATISSSKSMKTAYIIPDVSDQRRQVQTGVLLYHPTVAETAVGNLEMFPSVPYRLWGCIGLASFPGSRWRIAAKTV